MLRIVISDSSVLMDLAVGRLLAATSSLPYDFVIPDVILDSELLDLGVYAASDLLTMGFRKGDLPDVAAAFQLSAAHPALSLQDCFALAMASVCDGVLMTGDRRLRQTAERQGVETHGALWITSQLIAANQIATTILLDGLRRIHDHPRTRWPKQELERQIEQLQARE